MWNLAQSTYYYTSPTTSSGWFSGPFLLFLLALVVIAVVAGWKIFTKAGQAGWKSLIPIYNSVILMRIVGYSGWYVLIFLIPVVSAIFAIVVAYRLSKSFGYGVGMTILQLLVVGSLIIAFGSSKYLGPNGERSHSS